MRDQREEAPSAGARAIMTASVTAAATATGTTIAAPSPRGGSSEDDYNRGWRRELSGGGGREQNRFR